MHISTFHVIPALPDRLKGLREMAHNLLWEWDDELCVVFERLDRDLWEQTGHNPVLMLGSIAQERLVEVGQDASFLAFFEHAQERFRSYMEQTTWWEQRYQERPLVAYFSAEFGITECLPIYSGGLGVLAGDHLKSASDLGVPLVGVGLLYQQGYFNQYLTSDGWQQESYRQNDFYNLPLEQVTGADGEPLRIVLSLAGSPLVVQVWRAQVGRVPLFLLDTNLPENLAGPRDITDQLYGGDRETRIQQEIVLGIGGLRALAAMGMKPTVCHLNEGHAAFLALERIRTLIEEAGLGFHEALEVARAGNVFTTHTPVPAGIDVFPPDLVAKYLDGHREELGVSRRQLLDLGRGHPGNTDDPFSMMLLALRTSAFANGVSRLHGKISRAMVHPTMPQVPEHEIPIGHVTNGAHTWTWVSREMAQLFDRYLGPEWSRRPGQAITWKPVDDIPDEELWATHSRRRERLVAFARRRLVKQLEQRGASPARVEQARGVLDTRALTIGFARRFATYKRADLLLRDMQRLKRILLDPEKPVQLIFAGKAHPRDHQGKELLKAVVSFCQQDDVRRHAVFIEDYDLSVARRLVQGVDVWLNTPRRGMEASGTSGMKVVANGGLNLSVLDGWWAEAYEQGLGWAIGKGETYDDLDYQDYVESNALYDLLENDVVPLFYKRGADGLPREWVARLKRSLRVLCPTYSTNRMLWEYAERFYLPAARNYANLSADGMERGRRLAAWKASIREHWSDVRVHSVEARRADAHRVGEGFELDTLVHLGSVEPKDVVVEAYFGLLDAAQQIIDPRIQALDLDGVVEAGLYRYSGVLPCARSGLHGYAVRVVPSHPDAPSILTTGLMTWH